MSVPRVWIGPEADRTIAGAVERAGGAVVSDPVGADSIVWLSYERAPEIRDSLHEGIHWVQLPSAGVERWVTGRLLDDARVWTGAQGAYADDVAEHALAFVLAAARRLPQAARKRSWDRNPGRRLAGSTIGVLGAGGIGRAVIARLGPFSVRVVALSRSGRAVAGADRSVGPDGLAGLLDESDYVVLAAPLTEETRSLIGARELDLIGPDGWLVNVARGAIVQTDALVDALREDRIGGACLDVTDPEPLPDGHPLWDFENVLVTAHVANPPDLEIDLLAARVEENVRRLAEGRELLGTISPSRGY